MRTIFYVLLLMSTIIFLLVNWAGQETTISGCRKPRVNFYGVLETRAGNRFDVENILIDGLFKQIVVHEAPATLPEDFVLKDDPQSELMRAKLDLSEISQISVPSPDKVLTYKRKGLRKDSYVEIEVFFNNEQKTKRKFLVNLRKELQCDDKINAKPLELESPKFNTIRRLIIKGYKYNEPELEESQSTKKPSKNRQAA